MKLYLDSTSAQAFFEKLGPGSEASMRPHFVGQRSWYKIGRIATKDSPADLNMKSLLRERREYLARLIGLYSDGFAPVSLPSVQRLVKWLLVSGVLKGRNQFDDTCDGMKTTVVSSMWSICALCATVLILLFVIAVTVCRVRDMRVQLSRCRFAWRQIRKELALKRSEDPFRLEDKGEEEDDSGHPPDGGSCDDEREDEEDRWNDYGDARVDEDVKTMGKELRPRKLRLTWYSKKTNYQPEQWRLRDQEAIARPSAVFAKKMHIGWKPQTRSSTVKLR